MKECYCERLANISSLNGRLLPPHGLEGYITLAEPASLSLPAIQLSVRHTNAPCPTLLAAEFSSYLSPRAVLTSSWNVCTTFASPPRPTPNDPPGIQALSASRTASADGAAQSTEATEADPSLRTSVTSTIGAGNNPLSAGSSTSVPWTIVNKYYTADVHFETHEFEHFRVHHAIGVPAVIYVWGPGEVSACFFPDRGPMRYSWADSSAVQRTHPRDCHQDPAL